MDAQVTISLKEFDCMRDQIKNLKQEVTALCRAPKTVKTDSLCSVCKDRTARRDGQCSRCDRQ